ncbi:MAG: hypothetical protein AAF721_25985 [Myxococcota bacterium]
MRHHLIIFAIAAAPLACGKEKPPTAPPATDTAGATPAADDGAAAEPEEPKTWATMGWDEKKQHMMDEVTPKMAGLFQGVSAEHYAEFNCVTCHGPGAKEGKFKMPSDSLPKLPPNGDFAKLMEAKPDVMKFMGEQVVPEMAALLDTPPYDPSTNEGFGCYGCHQTEG